MGTFRNPVGPLPSNVYWRRRLVVLGIPLFVIAMVAYACTGTSGTPQNTAGGVAHSSASPTGSIITPLPQQTESGPPGNSYPGEPTGTGAAGGAAGGANGGAAGGTGGGTGGTGSTAGAGAANGGTAGGTGGTGSTGANSGGAGCLLTLSVALDRTSSSGPVSYPAGTYPTFRITASDTGTGNCTVNVSGRTLVVTVAEAGGSKPAWNSSICSGANDLRVLGPTDTQTYPVVWKRWESQGTECPVSQLPTVPLGSYTVSASTDGVTANPVQFILD